MNPSRKLHILVLILTGKLIVVFPLIALWITMSYQGVSSDVGSSVWQIRNMLVFVSVLAAFFAASFFLLYKKWFKEYEWERLMAESQLVNYSARLTSFIENPEHVSIFSLDKSLCYTGFNTLHKREMKEVFNADVELGRYILNLLPEDFANRLRVHFSRALKGEHFTIANEFSGKYYTLVFNPVIDNDGNVIGLTSNIFDGTDKIKAEQELEQYKDELEGLVAERTQQLEDQSEFLQKIVDNLPNLIFVRDETHRYVLVNKAMAHSFGMKVEDFSGRTISETHKSQEEAKRFQAEDKEIIANNSVFEQESKHQFPDGEFRWFHLSKRKMQVGADNYLLGVLNDITVLKEAEFKLIKANADLNETLIRLRSTQMRLVESEKMASLGQLTAGLAHEINNPINYVSGNLEPIRRDLKELNDFVERIFSGHEQNITQGQVPRDIRDLFQEMEILLDGVNEGASRVKALMADLNAFSLPDVTMKKPGNINDSLISTINLIKPQLKSRIELVENLQKIPDITCNQQQLRQVFLNLMTNAIQAIPGNGKITVSSQYEGDHIRVIIEDSGVGIDENTLGRIFDPFYTTKEVGEGTGLGLSVSYRIINDHNGNISVKSKGGEGSQFIVELPVV